MKKIFTLILLFVATFSYAGSKSSNDFSKSLIYQIFWNDSISVESYSSNDDFCLEYKGKDILTDGIEIYFGENYYKLYSPKLKTTFTVRPVKKRVYLGTHLIWLLDVVRTHQPEEFNFNYSIKTVSNP